MNQPLAIKPAKKPTISDVAQRAGVSVGTVSLALNGSDLCAASTAERVRQIALELGYVPNHAASSLRRQSTESIALVIPDIGNPVYVAMAKSVQAVAQARGYHLTLVSTDGAPQNEVHAINGLARRQVDGLIMCSLRVRPELVQALEAASAPVCLIGGLPESASVDNVRVNSEAGAVLAIAHLAGQGRRFIAFINGEQDTAPASARRRGYEQGLREHGLRLEAELIEQAAFTIEGGHAAAQRLLERRPDVDAVFCANDVIAIGALKALRERGLSVPERVAVVGMDDIGECLICTPTLSSVALFASDRGRIAAELLLERLTSQAPRAPQRVTVEPRLIVRESSAQPARRRRRS